MGKKKKYHIYGKVVGTKYLGEYEAESPEEAEEKAREDHDGPLSACWECTNEIGEEFEIAEYTIEEEE